MGRSKKWKRRKQQDECLIHLRDQTRYHLEDLERHFLTLGWERAATVMRMAAGSLKIHHYIGPPAAELRKLAEALDGLGMDSTEIRLLRENFDTLSELSD